MISEQQLLLNMEFGCAYSLKDLVEKLMTTIPTPAEWEGIVAMAKELNRRNRIGLRRTKKVYGDIAVSKTDTQSMMALMHMGKKK